MNYKESEKTLNAIRGKYGEYVFRCGISHMLDVGTRHLTDEMVESACEEILKQDDSRALMTNEFQCSILKCAAEISKIDHVHVLVYIGNNVEYDVGEEYED